MTPTVLVVDDEPLAQSLIRQRFRKRIANGELKFIFAEDGIAALQLLDQHPDIALVLTDINMPRMDGLTLLTKLHCPAIVISAYGDMEKIRKAMNNGAFDFLTKPIDLQDLEITLDRGLRHAQYLREQQENLQRTQTQLIQAEKLASIGQIIAGVAHEINNPVNFLINNLEPAKEYLEEIFHLLESYQKTYPEVPPHIQEIYQSIDVEFLKEDLMAIFNSMQLGAETLRNISSSLRNFARADSPTKIPIDVHSSIESTLLILGHRLKAKGKRPAITIVRNYGELPTVMGFPGQLNQVFLNLIANAIDALEEACLNNTMTDRKPTITIGAEVNSVLKITIADNGPGIPEAIQASIFQALFTTKPPGKGTGLGLSISKQIIEENHQGKLECYSEVGKGACFTISLPLNHRL